MKIALLHMTMGITTRGSEVVMDTLAGELAKHHNVLMIQSGSVGHKPYFVKQINPQSTIPQAAPTNILEELLFRLHLDQESGLVAEFTEASLPTLTKFYPDIIVGINGPLQIRLLQGLSSQAKIVTFGHAGIGYHDRDTIHAKPDLFVALTPSAASWAQSIADHKTRVVYIPNPIRIAKANKIDLKLPKPVVMCVGALTKYKNIDKIIEATRFTNASLLLIGDGEESKRIQQTLSTLANDFRWIRHIEPSDLPRYYASADVFCFVPDPQEAFGMVYLESMAAGLPIVASDDPIRRDLIGPHGIYVDPHDTQAIAEGINRAIQMSKVDYSKELKPFELKIVIKQIDKEFHDLID